MLRTGVLRTGTRCSAAWCHGMPAATAVAAADSVATESAAALTERALVPTALASQGQLSISQATVKCCVSMTEGRGCFVALSSVPSATEVAQACAHRWPSRTLCENVKALAMQQPHTSTSSQSRVAQHLRGCEQCRCRLAGQATGQIMTYLRARQTASPAHSLRGRGHCF